MNNNNDDDDNATGSAMKYSAERWGKRRRLTPDYEIRNGGEAYSCRLGSPILRAASNARPTKNAPEPEINADADAGADAAPADAELTAQDLEGTAVRLFHKVPTQGRATETAAAAAAAAASAAPAASKPPASTEAAADPKSRPVRTPPLPSLLEEGPGAEDDVDEDAMMMESPDSKPTAATHANTAPVQEPESNGRNAAAVGTAGTASPDPKPTPSQPNPPFSGTTMGRGQELAPGAGDAAGAGAGAATSRTKPPESTPPTASTLLKAPPTFSWATTGKGQELAAGNGTGPEGGTTFPDPKPTASPGRNAEADPPRHEPEPMTQGPVAAVMAGTKSPDSKQPASASTRRKADPPGHELLIVAGTKSPDSKWSASTPSKPFPPGQSQGKAAAAAAAARGAAGMGTPDPKPAAAIQAKTASPFQDWATCGQARPPGGASVKSIGMDSPDRAETAPAPGTTPMTKLDDGKFNKTCDGSFEAFSNQSLSHPFCLDSCCRLNSAHWPRTLGGTPHVG
jgi:hypothetical protein